MSMEKVKASLEGHRATVERLDDAFCDKVKVMGNLIGDTLERGYHIWIAGNGGCASLAQYFSNALANRDRRERAPLAVVCLSSDVSLLTGVASDLGFENIYKRQLQARASDGDLFIGLDARGHSLNICRALEVASDINVQSLVLVGDQGGRLGEIADHVMLVPSTKLARIHEIQLWAINTMCSLVRARA